LHAVKRRGKQILGKFNHRSRGSARIQTVRELQNPAFRIRDHPRHPRLKFWRFACAWNGARNAHASRYEILGMGPWTAQLTDDHPARLKAIILQTAIRFSVPRGRSDPNPFFHTEAQRHRGSKGISAFQPFSLSVLQSFVIKKPATR